MIEEFREIEGYNGRYLVSNLGYILSIYKSGRKRLTKREVPLKLKHGLARGYPSIVLALNGVSKSQRVHRLVAEAFVPKSAGKDYVCHLDGNRLNNTSSNLRWGTNRENMADKKRHGTEQSGERNPSAKLTLCEVYLIRKELPYKTNKDIAAMFGVSAGTISHIRTQHTWKIAV